MNYYCYLGIPFKGPKAFLWGVLIHRMLPAIHISVLFPFSLWLLAGFILISKRCLDIKSINPLSLICLILFVIILLYNSFAFLWIPICWNVPLWFLPVMRFFLKLMINIFEKSFFLKKIIAVFAIIWKIFNKLEFLWFEVRQ